MVKIRLLSSTALSLAIGAVISSSAYTANREHRTPIDPMQIAANPCRANPCGAKPPCSPCAASNPCKASAPRGAANPCAAARAPTPCVVPRLAAANPCAASNPCNPCSPATGDQAEPLPPELTEIEAAAAYDCVAPHLAGAYRASGQVTALAYRGWSRFNRVPYPAEAHGARFMNNYANAVARGTYGKWEGLANMPAGSVLAKDSFIVSRNGKVSVGPLLVMTKHDARFNAAMRDWRYEMIMPDGEVRGDADLQKFCNDCHRRAGAPDDNLMFVPLPYRVSAKPGR